MGDIVPAFRGIHVVVGGPWLPTDRSGTMVGSRHSSAPMSVQSSSRRADIAVRENQVCHGGSRTGQPRGYHQSVKLNIPYGWAEIYRPPVRSGRFRRPFDAEIRRSRLDALGRNPSRIAPASALGTPRPFGEKCRKKLQIGKIP